MFVVCDWLDKKSVGNFSNEDSGGNETFKKSKTF